jgi:hypothetical protein
VPGPPVVPPPERVQLHEVEGMRRSLAMSANLTKGETERLINTCGHLLVERVDIQRILAELGPAWGGTKRALNELHKIIRR